MHAVQLADVLGSAQTEEPPPELELEELEPDEEPDELEPELELDEPEPDELEEEPEPEELELDPEELDEPELELDDPPPDPDDELELLCSPELDPELDELDVDAAPASPCWPEAPVRVSPYEASSGPPFAQALAAVTRMTSVVA